VKNKGIGSMSKKKKVGPDRLTYVGESPPPPQKSATFHLRAHTIAPLVRGEQRLGEERGSIVNRIIKIKMGAVEGVNLEEPTIHLGD